MTEEQLKIELNKAIEEASKAIESIPSNLSYDAFEARVGRFQEKVDALSLAYRLVKTPVMSRISEHAHHMTLEDFVGSCKEGWFIDYDGSSNYATETEESDISVYPSDVTDGKLRKDFTHVVWYNR